MNQEITYRSKATTVKLLALMVAVCALTLIGCSDQATNPGITSADLTLELTSPGDLNEYQDTIEKAMQISPHMINLQSNGTAESVRAIVSLYIPYSYRLTDYDFTLSFNGEDVTAAYDCYYCYVDNNLIISFAKDEILTSPVTIGFVNSEVEATVNGFFRVESDTDGYDTGLSTYATVEIVRPAANVATSTK